MSTYTETKPLRIGVFHESVQMSDLVGLDVFGNMSTKVAELISSVYSPSASAVPHAVPMQFFYISSSLELAFLTPDAHVKPTYTYETAPKDLDILLIGGPDPTNVPEASLAYLREAAKQTKVIMTVCTGGMWLGRSGVLNGKKATTNRTFLAGAKSMMPDVEWVDQRWVVDKLDFEGAEIWTAGGAGCGIDMVVKYVKMHFHEKIVALSLLSLDFGPEELKGQFYNKALA